MISSRWASAQSGEISPARSRHASSALRVVARAAVASSCGLDARQHRVHALEVEAEVRLRARLAERLLLGVLRPVDALLGDQRDRHRHAGRRAGEEARAPERSRAAGTARQRGAGSDAVGEPCGSGSPSRPRPRTRRAAPRPCRRPRAVSAIVSVGARVVRARASSAVDGDPLSRGPERALIDGGEQRDALADRVDGREVLRAERSRCCAAVVARRGPTAAAGRSGCRRR